SPGSSVAIYFALENGEETYLGQNTDWDAVGVRALDDRTVEFRLSAPAPYFMSVMHRRDSGPQPPHAIDGIAEARPVSGAFAVAGNLELRRALAHAIDREALAAVCPANLVVASGGVVPPALQGHTPDIALRYDPDLARECLARSGYDGSLELAGMMVWDDILD